MMYTSGGLMSPERFREIRKLFETVLERDRDTRAAFLAAASAGDTVLYEEVQKLLIAHDHVDAYMVPPVLVPPNAMEYPRLEGRRIGPYEILREIGHGGMGSVYFAVRSDDIYRKHVAFKVLRSASNKEVIRRFQQERRILASLEHPNIATLLDGGTTEEGLPYFVMEYVEGHPLFSYCDSHKLTIAERLRLFRKVCSAVQYAHQHRVIHRDLKPSNVLVTTEGVPKLLDFGIAKLLDPDLASQTLDPTTAAVRLMTPEYASPEQVLGETVTPGSDVYSLGVLLYELLTDHRPYKLRDHSPYELARVICEE